MSAVMTADEWQDEVNRLQSEVERLTEQVTDLDDLRSRAVELTRTTQERVSELERFIADIADQSRRV
jgi:polyhydroxyalkanoate synthesis regulator phasin